MELSTRVDKGDAARYGAFAETLQPNTQRGAENDWTGFRKNVQMLGGVAFACLCFCLVGVCYDLTWWQKHGINFIKAAQVGMTESNAKEQFWAHVTYFGEDFPEYLSVMMFLAFNSQIGLRLCILLSVDIYINATLKALFHDSRPYWITTEVRIFDTCTRTWGNPATHASIVASFWLYFLWECYHTYRPLRARFNATPLPLRVVGVALAVAFIITVGLSRSVLGTHFPYQVMVGWSMGATLLCYFVSESPHISSEEDVAARKAQAREAFWTQAVAVPVAFAVVPAVIYHVVASTWENPVKWNVLAVENCTQEAGWSMDKSSAFIEAICGMTMYMTLKLFEHYNTYYYPVNTDQGPWYLRLGRILYSIFGVILRFLLIVWANSLTNVVYKAIAMAVCIVVSNFVIFFLGPWMFVSCSCLERRPVTMSPSSHSEEAHSLLQADKGDDPQRVRPRL